MSSTELAVIDHNDLETIQRTARMLAVSGYFDAKGESPVALAQMAVKILAGRELGFGPFAAVRGIHIIQGAPSVSASLMAAAVKSSRRYDYRVREHTAQVCRIEFFERTDAGKWEPVGFSEFSVEDAKRAGTKNMDKYPKNMLFARAMSNGVRFYCPDVFSGVSVYTPEELGADVDADGDVVDAYPTRPETLQRPQASHTSEYATNGANAPHSAPDAPTGASAQAAQADDNPFEDVSPYGRKLIASWLGPQDAYAWAIKEGACANEFEARNSLKKIVEGKFGGKLTQQNMTAVLTAFYLRQDEKLAALVDDAEAEAAQAELAAA